MTTTCCTLLPSIYGENWWIRRDLWSLRAAHISDIPTAEKTIKVLRLCFWRLWTFIR